MSEEGKKDTRSYYTTLGLEPTASQEDIKAAYRKYTSWSHPDRNNGETKWMQEVNEANDCLSNPELRKEYDSIGLGTYREVLEEQAKSRIMGIVSEGISVETIDLLMYVALQIQQKLKSYAVQKGQVSKEEEKSLRYLGKIKRRSPEKLNFIEVLIKSRMKELQNARDSLDREVAISNIAIELLKDFEYDPSAEAEVAYRRSGVAGIGFSNLRIGSL